MNKPELISAVQTRTEPILANGKTLEQNRKDIQAITKETGHYDGLKELKLKKAEPILFERIFSKLRDGVVRTRDSQVVYTANQTTATVFDNLVGESHVGIDADISNDLLNDISDHVITGNSCSFIKDPILRCTYIALALMQPITHRFIIDAGLATGDLQTITKALDLAIRH